MYLEDLQVVFMNLPVIYFNNTRPAKFHATRGYYGSIRAAYFHFHTILWTQCSGKLWKTYESSICQIKLQTIPYHTGNWKMAIV